MKKKYLLVLVVFILISFYQVKVFAVESVSKSKSQEVDLNKVGQRVEDSLGKRKNYTFNISIQLKEYLEIQVEQFGTQLSVEVADEFGNTVINLEMPTSLEETLKVGFVAHRTGKYIMTLRPVRPAMKDDGRFCLTVMACRAATSIDNSFDRALRALTASLKETNPAKALGQTEAAYEILLPLLGPRHANVRAALLAYVHKAQKDKWLRAAQLAEPILAVREKEASAPLAELLDWNGVILRGYLTTLEDYGSSCKDKDKISILFSREIRLRDQVFGPGDSETQKVFAALAAFHRHCEPDKFPDLIEGIIAERVSLLGEIHPSITALLQIYGQSLTFRSFDRFSAFLDRRTEATLADPQLSRQAKVLGLFREVQALNNIAVGQFLRVDGNGTSAFDDQSPMTEDLSRAKNLKVADLYQQAMSLIEPDKEQFQWQYLLCLEEIRRLDESRLPDYEDRLLGFADSIKQLERPQMLSDLGEAAGRLEAKIDPLVNMGCPPNASETTRTKEKIHRVYEEIFRLAESQFSHDSEIDIAGPDGFGKNPDQPGKSKIDKVTSRIQNARKEIDDETLAYAGFLFSSGEQSAASDALERGLAFRLRHDSDSIDALIFFAAGFDLAGNEARAAELYGQLLTLAERAETEDVRHKRLFQSLPAIAQFHERYGRYDEAESIYHRLGKITEQLRSKTNGGATEELGSDQVDFSVSKQGLVWIAAARGDEKAFAERLLILHREFPSFVPDGSNDQSYLRSPTQWRENQLIFYAAQYAQFGNYERASALIDRLGKDPVDESVSSIAGLTLIRMGRMREALAYFERSVLTRAATDPTGAGKGLRWLLVFEEQFNPPEVVLVFLDRVEAQFEKRPDSRRERMFLLSQVGRFQTLAGQPDKALGTYRRLTEMGQGVTGVPIQVQERIALELWRGGQGAAAIRQQIAVNDLRESQLIQMALEKMVPWPRVPFLGNPPPWFMECVSGISTELDMGFSEELNRTVSLQVSAFSGSAIARRAALESALRRKGRTPEAFVDSVPPRRFRRQFLGEGIGLIREVAQLEFKSIPRMAEVTWQLSMEFGGLGSDGFSRWCLRTNRTDGLRFEPPIEHYSRMKKGVTYTAAVTSLASQIIEQYPEFRLSLTPVTVEAVQKALPADGALVEVVRYAPFNPKTGTTEGEERYAVYVLMSRGEPQWFDGGTVGKVDQAATVLANEARDYADDESRAATAVLENRFIEPALKLMGTAKRVYIAFDERLATLPLKKLTDVRGKPFDESRKLIFIRSGRELLGMDDQNKSVRRFLNRHN